MPFILLLIVFVSPAAATPLLACPQEIVHYPPVTIQQMKGRLLPPDGEELLPDTRVEFVIRKKGNDRSERWDVRVGADGTFVAGLPEGTYEFEVRVEGFLFTLVGDVTIDDERGAAAMELEPPWC